MCCRVPSAFIARMSLIDRLPKYGSLAPHDPAGAPLRYRTKTIVRPSGDQANAVSPERSPVLMTDTTVPSVVTVVNRGTQVALCETRWMSRPSADQDAVIAGPRRRAAPPAAGTTQAAPAAAYRRSPVGGAGIADGSADAGTVETSGDAEAGGRVAADAGDGPSDAGVGAGVAVHAASATARAQARRDRFARDQISTPDASRNPA